MWCDNNQVHVVRQREGSSTVSLKEFVRPRHLHRAGGRDYRSDWLRVRVWAETTQTISTIRINNER